MLLVDADTYAGNKVIAVTGALNLYGVIPGATSTRLTAKAVAGSSTIEVGSAAGWKVGDLLCVGGSESGYSEHEFVTITAISGESVTLGETLAFLHYGAAAPTHTNKGIIDMRANVAHLTRNIRFTCEEVDNWGGRVLVTKFFDYANFK